jgi:hypothetical protein
MGEAFQVSSRKFTPALRREILAGAAHAKGTERREIAATFP